MTSCLGREESLDKLAFLSHQVLHILLFPLSRESQVHLCNNARALISFELFSIYKVVVSLAASEEEMSLCKLVSLLKNFSLLQEPNEGSQTCPGAYHDNWSHTWVLWEGEE